MNLLNVNQVRAKTSQISDNSRNILNEEEQKLVFPSVKTCIARYAHLKNRQFFQSGLFLSKAWFENIHQTSSFSENYNFEKAKLIQCCKS